MNIKKKILTALLLALVVPAMAADKAPVMDEAMKKAMALGAPSEHHKLLEPLMGTWTTAVKFWMKPGDKAQESKGSATTVWINGGRFLKQSYAGDMMGMRYEGLGYTGYDNVRQEYSSIWIDNMNTGMMEYTGTYDAAKKTFNFGGTFSCPMSGEKNRPGRAEIKIVNNDKYTYSSYSDGADGKEFKDMEIIYTRTK